MPESTSNPPVTTTRRWTIVAAGLLLLALALVVIYTSRGAFLSPIALVVVAAIGLAALLLQLRLRDGLRERAHAPLWLNVLGIACAIAAVGSDVVHARAILVMLASLAAVVCFAVSGMIVLSALRRERS